MHQGVPVTPSAPKVRQVLALLALRANSTVPLHQLVEELWEERPPSSAATTLQTYIYQLRKLPGLSEPRHTEPCATPQALLTTPGGYRLSVPQDCLDSRRFADLAARGRAAMEDGAVTEAADLLHRALAVWRGPALSDLAPGPIVGIDALRLEEQRYAVLEERIDADLILGRHHRLISELTALAADNPTREGLHGKLMLSLYRAGRRPDALEVFQRIRRVLIRELGLEPCSELQRLHQQLLEGDRGLDLPAGRVTVHGAPAANPPMTLPADVPLIGREAELARLGTALRESAGQDRPRCVSVAGAPGAGTTAFGVALAHRLGDAFPDGQLYVSFGDPAAPRAVEDVLADLLEAVGHRRSELPPARADRARLFQSWTAGRRALLVVDDVAAAHQVTDLIPADSGSAVLVAGYRRLYGGQFGTPVDLPPIGPDHAVEFLLGTLGRNRLLDDGSWLRRMVDLCGGLPGPMAEAVDLLALRPHWSIRQLIDWMNRERPTTVSEQRPHPFHHVRRRCAGLAPGLCDALVKLAREAGEVLTVEQAARILGRTADEAEELLEELVEFFLLEVDLVRDRSSERFFQYRMPPLLRAALRTAPVGALA
ncbi:MULTISPECIES: AfsR/SARP family transcriptional regulator [Streptomyces]|uniref:BTAD domain-containing putative transcriptional regulator n=1 Tax=Streptomyces solicathayae TaxID=3081768 RepID=A0ABZ0LXH4_9ACTN|nr:BTAD domain-containing putative transcriptional regulator [Streptomyces sp. HUAS YS2]WOX24218.1 BTAD domain-containing putative transcriptional regulator [Streptomyces sp. HUAS YS2]